MKYFMRIRELAGNGMASTELMAAMEKLVEDMTKSGVLLDTGGFQEKQSGVSLRLEKAKISVTDGPYTDANEVIGGYAIVHVASKEAAVEFAKHFLDIHSRIMGPDYQMEMEVSRMYSVSES